MVGGGGGLPCMGYYCFHYYYHYYSLCFSQVAIYPSPLPSAKYRCSVPRRVTTAPSPSLDVSAAKKLVTYRGAPIHARHASG